MDNELTIETERLRIGPLSAPVRKDLIAIWLDPANSRIHADDTEEQARRWVEDGTWGVWEKATGELVGDCTLFYSEDHHAWEVGYGLLRDRWGRGYATEAVVACLRYGFERLGLDRIVADVDAQNWASMHVLEKCGFVRDGGTDAHPVFAVTR
jgi:RimJ/RimL family protein N-acetyltransferase